MGYPVLTRPHANSQSQMTIRDRSGGRHVPAKCGQASTVWATATDELVAHGVEHLVPKDDARGNFENMSDLDAFIVAGVEDGEMFCGCPVNPDIDLERECGALGWCAQLVTRIEDLGFDQAMITGGWQQRGDGRWQLWGRSVDLPPFD